MHGATGSTPASLHTSALPPPPIIAHAGRHPPTRKRLSRASFWCKLRPKMAICESYLQAVAGGGGGIGESNLQGGVHPKEVGHVGR